MNYKLAINKVNITEISRYLIAGASAFSLDILVLYILTEYFEIHYLVSNIAGYFSGLIIVYLLNIKWVFSVRKYKQTSIEFTIFVIIAIVGLLLSELLMWFFVEQFATDYMLSKIVASAFVVIFNYIARKILLFTL